MLHSRALPSLFTFAFTSLLATATAANASSAPVRTDHLQSQLVAETAAAVPGTRLTLGLLLEHDPHWHTYWRNPGDSGLPTEIEWTLPDGVVAEPIAWPHPQRFEISEIVNFGFEGRRLLPVTIVIPADYAAPTLPVSAAAKWLICEEECIPGKAQYAFELPVAATADVDPRWTADFADARADQPQPATTALAITEDGDDIVLVLADLATSPARWTWFPETKSVVANRAGPQWQRTDAGWQGRWPKSDYFTALPAEAMFVAVDEGGGGSGIEDTAAWRFTGIAAAGAATPSPADSPAPADAPTRADTPGDDPLRWWPTLVFAAIAVAITVLLRSKSRSRRKETDR